MEKIILLQPPVSFKEKTFALVPNCPHLGLLYLASSLMREGFEVIYLDTSDNNVTMHEIKDLIQKQGVSIICITAMTQNIKGAVQLARFLKEDGCSAKIILGGPHLSADVTLPERYPYFDASVAGESEITLPAVINDLLNGKTLHSTVRGQTPLNLNALPFPARHIIDHSIYFKRGLNANGIFATRGCPYQCNFCSIPAIDKKVRYRSVELITEEMKEAVVLTDLRTFNFSDDALTINKKFVYSLCEQIHKLPYTIKWEAQSRINYIDRPLLRAMRKSGCYKLLFGIESGNERIRNQVIGKGISDEQIVQITKLCWQEGIEPDHYLMIGHPTETMKEINETINCPLKFKPNIIGVFLTMPLPGSLLFDQSISEGIVEKDVIDRYIHGDYGQGYQGCWPYYIPKGLTQGDLIIARNLTLRKFYFRFSYVAKRFIRDCFSLTRIKRDIKEGISLLTRNRSADDFNVDKNDSCQNNSNVTSEMLHQLEKFITRLPLLYQFLKKCKVQYQKVKYFIFKIAGKDKELIYNQSFFCKNLEWNIPIAESVASILIGYFHPHSVVDVGCGNAEFLAQFQKKGIEIKGYEGSPHALKKSMVQKQYVEQFDLRRKIAVEKKYDLALCLEVAEHIEKRFSAQLVDNVTSLSDVVVFTAAPPGQGGHFHINEQPKEYWIKLFSSKGFALDEPLSLQIRFDFKKKDIVRWYAENIIVFKKN